MDEELKLEPETPDANGITNADVLAEMAKEGLSVDDPGTGAEKPEKTQEDALRELGADVKGKIEDGDARIRLGEDTTFDEDARAKVFVDKMAVNVRAEDIPVTDDDKVAYVKALLMDTEVVLEVPMAGGRVTAEFRSLTAYEQDLVMLALAKYFNEHKTAGYMLLEGIRQHLMIAMELVRFNGKPVEPIRYKAGEGTVDENAASLLAKAERYTDVDGPRLSFLIAAADVFHKKMTRLGEAALNKDFWDPAFAG